MTALVAPVTVRVEGPSPYDVLIGDGVLKALATLVGSSADDAVVRAAVVHPAGVSHIAHRCADALSAADVRVSLLQVPDAEEAKTAALAVSCWDALGAAGFTRSDWVVGVGGGATTDLAGFVAATWLRGVRFVSVPTTLLGMVDAAVGGKTGINTAAGKNLVGSFHEPTAVLCDLEVLAALPAAECQAGLAEVIKCGFIADPVILDLIEADLAVGARFAPGLSAELVRRSVEIKARVVAGDLTERGADGGVGREILNYGHTLAHAVERASTSRGGMVTPSRSAWSTWPNWPVWRGCSTTPPPIVTAHPAGVGLPVSYPAEAWPELAAGMRLDKKTRGDISASSSSTAWPNRRSWRARPRPCWRRPTRRSPRPRSVGCRRARPRPNGPDLNRLGTREPDGYGARTLRHRRVVPGARSRAGPRDRIPADELGGGVDRLAARCRRRRTPVVLNPAAFTHYSYGVRDACAMLTAPLIEVHLSNPHARESFVTPAWCRRSPPGRLPGSAKRPTRWR